MMWPDLRNAPYLILSDVSIEMPVVIEPGADFVFEESAGLAVQKGGSLSAVGTVARPITFTGRQRSPGFWYGITFHSNSPNNRLEYVTVSDGGSDYGNVIVGYYGDDEAELNMSHTTLSNSGRYGLYVSTGSTCHHNTVTFSNNAEGNMYSEDD